MDPSQLPQLRHSEGDSCPECKSGKLVENQDQGELACLKCGYVAAERLEDHKIRIKYDENDNPISSLTVPFQKSSFIANSKTDYSGAPIRGEMKQTMERLRLWDSRAGSTSRQRTIKASSIMISKWSKDLGVTNNAINEANRMFAKALDAQIVRGRTIRGIAIASLKLSCKVNGIPRDEKQFLEVSGVRKKELGRSYRILVKKLNIDSMSMGNATNPQDFLGAISGKLGIPEGAIREAAKILDRATQIGFLAGKNRVGLAASALYIACRMEGLAFSQDAISSAAKISTVTIRHDLVFLADKLNIGPFKKIKVQPSSQKFHQKVNELHEQTPKISNDKQTSVPIHLRRRIETLTSLSRKLGLDEKSINDAIQFYIKGYNQGVSSTKYLSLASIQASSIINNKTPFTNASLSNTTITDKNLSRSYRFMQKIRLLYPIDYLPNIIDHADLSDEVKQRTRELVKKSQDINEVIKFSPRTIIASSLYIALRESGDPNTRDKTITITRVNEHSIKRCSYTIRASLNITFHKKITNNQNSLNEKKDQYLKILTENLPKAKDISERITQLLDLSQNKNIIHLIRPSSAVAAAFAISCDEAGLEMSPSDVSEKLGLNHHTVLNAVKIIKKGLELPKVSHVQNYILKISEDLKIPKEITLFAQDLDKKLKQNNLFLNTSEKMLSSSLLYVSCLYNEYDIKPKDLYPKYHLSRYAFDLTMKGINDKLDLNLRSGRRLVKRKEADLKELIKSVSDSGQIPQNIINRANEIVEKSKEINLLLTSATKTVLSGAIYAAALELGEEIGPQKISEITGISDSVIGFTGKRLIGALEIKVKEVVREDPKIIREAKLTKFASDLASSLDVNQKIKEDAENILHKMIENKLVVGSNIPAAICVSLYTSCRLNGAFNTIKEVYQNAQSVGKNNFSYKMFTAYYRKTVQELDLKIPLPDKEANLIHLAEKFDLSQEAKNEVLKELSRIKVSTEGLNPVVTGAALIYKAAIRTGEKLKQDEIASKLGITSTSIRNALNKINY